MKLQQDILLDFDDVLIRPKRSVAASRSSVKLERDFFFYHSPRKWSGVPIMASNMAVTGTEAMALALAKHKCSTCLHKFYKKHVNVGADYCWISTGMEISDTLNSLIEAGYEHEAQLRPDTDYDINLCIDVANGYTEKFVEAVRKYRRDFPNAIIMAGNVATREMTEHLILAGADIVKVGIGPGKACQTRMVTGVGYPQLSAIMECADAAHGLRAGDKRIGLVCADGGMSTPGDIAKAFGAGADFVMLGSMLAGTDECDGEWKYVCQNNIDRKHSLRYYGMSSYAAQRAHYGKSETYRASEGKVLTVDYKGPVEKMLKEIMGGLRSACAYTGADSLKDFPRCCTFVQCNRVHRTPEWKID